MGLTDRFDIYTSDVRTFSGHPIRLYIDNNLPITICSFKREYLSSHLQKKKRKYNYTNFGNN